MGNVRTMPDIGNLFQITISQVEIGSLGISMKREDVGGLHNHDNSLVLEILFFGFSIMI